MNETKVTLNKPVYLGLSIPDIVKIVTYEYQYDYAKPKHGDYARLCLTDTDSLIAHIKSKGVYEGDFETRSNASGYEIKRAIWISKAKKMIRQMKDVLSK